MKNIIIFGTGDVGKSAALFLKRKYNILFFADNDKNKWNSSFEGYDIKSPDQIQQYDCDIIVASTKYAVEITDQLWNMKVGQSRIYLCRRYRTDGGYKSDIYPLEIYKLTGTGKKLIEYDLLDIQGNKKGCIKVLVFCIFFSTYTKQLIENMAGRYNDIEFSLLTSAEESRENINSVSLRHIYCFKTMSDLKTILEQLPVYDVMQLLWIEREWVYFRHLIRNRTKKLNLNVGGSDFYRAGMSELEHKRSLIEAADNITAETPGTIGSFIDYYGLAVNEKMGLLPFGIEVLDFINRNRNTSIINMKKRFKVPEDKIIVTCGHNANGIHQHLKIIDALVQMPEEIKEKIICIFPMTYPEEQIAYIDKVRSKLANSGLEYIILTDFMDFQSMAEYALISDIMIHVQTTDQLSSTMLEEMYAGSVVIAGSWLPYQSLHEMGIYFLDVDEVADITNTVADAVMNINEYKQRCEGNPEIIWNHSSWDSLAPKWHKLWE